MTEKVKVKKKKLISTGYMCLFLLTNLDSLQTSCIHHFLLTYLDFQHTGTTNVPLAKHHFSDTRG